jgi:hypothetical protein
LGQGFLIGDSHNHPYFLEVLAGAYITFIFIDFHINFLFKGLQEYFLNFSLTPGYRFGILRDMTLKEYFNRTQGDRERFAKEIGTTPAYLSHLIFGHRQPSVKLAARIIKATNGKVGVKDLWPDIAAVIR